MLALAHRRSIIGKIAGKVVHYITSSIGGRREVEDAGLSTEEVL